MEKSLISHILRIIRQHFKILAIAFVLITLANILLISNPLIMRFAIEHSLNPFVWAPILLLIAFLSSILRYTMRLSFGKVSRFEEQTMRSKIYGRIQNQTMAFFDRHGIGELTSRLSGDISSYRDILGPVLLFPIYFLTTLIPGIIALFWIAPKLALVAMIPVFAIPLINFSLRGVVYSLSSRYQAELARMSNFVQETFSGIRIVKSYGVENALLHRFMGMTDDLLGINIKLMTYQGLSFPFLTLITRLTTLFIVIATAYFMINKSELISIADFTAFMWIQSYIYFPVLILGWVFPIYQQGRASYDRLKNIYDEPIEITEGKSDLILPPNSTIEFNHLTFYYPNQVKPSIDDLSLKLEGGKFIGITGPAGAGKSTLFKLLNREYEIPFGMISIAGRDIHDYPVSSFYEDMVTVEQIPFLFSKSIRDNVSFGREGATQEEIEWASNLADLHNTVIDFSESYDTLVGEKGVALSGGQKQRVAIARAFLVERSILLLDDIFSAVDNATEGRIFKAIQENFKGKTVLLSTQRVSVLEKMDEVVYLSHGKVLEQGKPSDLLLKRGYFATMKELEGLNEPS